MSKRKTKAPTAPRQHERLIQCVLCEDKPEFLTGDTPGYTQHLRALHPELLTNGKPVLNQKGVAFLDGADFYSNSFELRRTGDADGPVVAYMRESGPREQMREWGYDV